MLLKILRGVYVEITIPIRIEQVRRMIPGNIMEASRDRNFIPNDNERMMVPI
jgi:hypothetical protein